MGERMRDIKFRLWDMKNFKMYHPHVDQHSWYFDDEYDSIQFPMENDGFLNYKSEKNAILLQYTGLKDKNDKEIYEGDILRVTEDPVFGGEDDFVGVIKFYECAFWIDNERQGKASRLFNEITEHEVIGNIYKNPELLEGK
ncbi:YopX family protein [Mesobacillus subterraneus]|uniref:YopX family protein n=1 Tax=Mesobacillus subterraneus TaxID=285983 RepID=UPI00203D40D2|nr:YopX family protein [Mesobacillus subterraneus]MCM3573311.1 YopX family protein [Mesobacillus subterraneus]